jgi:hypothetical protein
MSETLKNSASNGHFAEIDENGEIAMAAIGSKYVISQAFIVGRRFAPTQRDYRSKRRTQ